jgi:HlyD family secretion protein
MAETPGPSPRRDAAKRRAGRRRRRVLLNVVIGLAIIAIVIFVLVSRARRRAGQVQGLITGEVTRGSIVEMVSASGSVTPQTGAMVNIGSQITGRIKYLYADVGSLVREGQVIAELSVPDLEAQVTGAKAALAASQQQLAQQVAGLPLQETQSGTALEQADAGVESAKAALSQAQDTARLQVAAAQASVDQAQANATNSDSFLKRQEQLYDQGYIAASDVDTARAQAGANEALLASAKETLRITRVKVASDITSAEASLRQARATLTSAEAGMVQPDIKRQQVKAAEDAVRQSQASLVVAQVQRDKGFIRSPISGTVIHLAQQEGETVAAALAAPTLIVVVDLDRLQVDAFVDETDIAKVSLGQRAEVTVDAYPNRSFHGVVQTIASGATIQQNVVTYDVTISLENAGHLLKPDMTATINIRAAEHKDVLLVPVDAIKPSTSGNTVTVMTTRKGAKPQFEVVSVETGISNGEVTEIVKGLKEGQTVVLAGQVPGMVSQQGPRFRGGLFGGGRGGGQRGGGGQQRGGGQRGG